MKVGRGGGNTYRGYRCVILEPSGWTGNNWIALSNSGSEVSATMTVPSIISTLCKVLQRSPCKVGDCASLGFGSFRPRDGLNTCNLTHWYSPCMHASSPHLSLCLHRLVFLISLSSPYVDTSHIESCYRQCLDHQYNKPCATSRTVNWVQAPFVQHRAGDI